jgi:hypothetical protein
MTIEEHIKKAMEDCPLREHQEGKLLLGLENYLNEIEQLKNRSISTVVGRLKSIRRFNLAHYREGEYGIDTEREYDSNGDYIDSYEIYEVIRELENGL